MRSLIIFIVRNHAFLLFLLLELTCIFLIQQNKSFQQAAFFNAAQSITGFMYKSRNDLADYFQLKKINDSLQVENARLHQQVTKFDQALNAVKDNSVRTVYDSTNLQCYEYIEAKVVNNSINRFNNYLTLDKGSKHGIRKDMGVICSRGIVGFVTDVSENFSTVMSVLHKQFRTSGKLKKNNEQGSITWKGNDPWYSNLEAIGQHVDIRRGDTVVTTGFSPKYPENIMIGTISDFNIRQGENFYDIKVGLSTNFSSLQYVLVVNYIQKEERAALENTTQID